MQNPYNSPLIDELHNHFPAILYDSGRFATMYDLLQYVRQQMAARYDTYTSRRNAYVRSNPGSNRDQRQRQQQRHEQRQQQQRQQQQRQQQPMSSWRTTMQGTIPQPILPTPVMTPQQNTWEPPSQTFSLDPVTQLLVRAMTMPVSTTPGVPFWDSVPIAPTSQQIDAASQAYEAPSNLDTPCAICQDTIRETDMIRRLSHCNHFFHRTCVDTWFQRNVHCPVCRHDIRQRRVGTPSPYIARRDE